MTPETIKPLIDKHLDGSATAEEASRLALALLEDPATARAFAQATRLEAGLRSCFQAEAVGRRLAASARIQSGPRWRPARAVWSAAAAVVVAGVSFLWWRSWVRPGERASLAAVVAKTTPKTVGDTPPAPPSLRRPGALSPAAAEVKRMVARYWLPERIEFSETPLEEAVMLVQQRAGAVNHLRNATISGFAVDLPEEVSAAPVTASRAELPLGAWLELLSAQVGCELRFTDTGVAFDPVERPDTLETRQFPLPTIADADAPAESPARLFSYTRPWEAEPDFRSAPAHGQTLAAAWGIPLPESTRMRVRDGGTLEVRHSRRELRRIEGLLAVAGADAGRPMVTFRAKEVPLPVPAAPVVADVSTRWSEVSGAGVDDYLIDLQVEPEVIDFEGWVHYSPLAETKATDAAGQPQELAVTESVIEQPVFATRPAGGNRVVGNDEAAGLLGTPPGRLFSNTPLIRSMVFMKGYEAGRDAAATGSMRVPDLAEVEATVTEFYGERGDTASFNVVPSFDLPSLAVMARGTEQAVMLGDQLATTEPGTDPWQRTVKTKARLGESTWMATGEAAIQEVVGKGIELGVGFSLLDLQPPPPLNTTARLEGEMVKLTGTFTPGGGAAPTDFEAYVAEGQSLVLQTEDVPSVPASGGVVDWDVNGRVAGIAGVATPADGAQVGHTVKWFFIPQAAPASVRGVVISPVLEWPSAAGK